MVGLLGRTRIKICGITRADDAQVAAEQGADAIGLVFYPHSPRAVTVDSAATIVAGLPPFVTTVALFVDAAVDEVRQVLANVPIDLLQFHGDEPEDYCQSFERPYIKAIRMQDETVLSDEASRYASAQALLVDTYVKGVAGGTGESFDWSLLPETLNKPIILAGGLTPENVQSAISQVHPWAVDVSGGVEASKGIKDADKIMQFVKGVRHVDAG